jgi:hypothetical protein
MTTRTHASWIPIKAMSGLNMRFNHFISDIFTTTASTRQGETSIDTQSVTCKKDWIIRAGRCCPLRKILQKYYISTGNPLLKLLDI